MADTVTQDMIVESLARREGRVLAGGRLLLAVLRIGEDVSADKPRLRAPTRLRSIRHD
jgi:hypothetical protein